MGIKFIDEGRARAAQNAPDSDGAKILRIEQAASEAFPNDMAARFAYRNQLRADAGLPPEERKRGGIAGAYDKGFLAPALALGLGPLALGLGGGAAGGTGAASTAGAGAAGAAGAGGAIAPVAAGGFLSKAGDFLKSNALPIATGVAGVLQQNRGNEIQADAAKADAARWSAGAPLRDAGMAGLLAPTPADTSSLRALQGRGNPFATPSAPTLAPTPAVGGPSPVDVAPPPPAAGAPPPPFAVPVKLKKGALR